MPEQVWQRELKKAQSGKLRFELIKSAGFAQQRLVRQQVTPPPPVKPRIKATLDTDVVIVLGAVLCVLICAVWVHSVIRCIIRRNRRLEVTAGGVGATSNDVSTVGLDPKTIAALPVVPASVALDPVKDPVADPVTLSSNTECIVCLQEFRQHEKMKLLPNCGHGFHTRCIGAWLTAHSSCPICRHGVLEPPSPGSNSNSNSNSGSFVASSSSAALLLSPAMRQMQLELSSRNLEHFQARQQRLQRQREELQQQILQLQNLRERDSPGQQPVARSSSASLYSMFAADFTRSNFRASLASPRR